MELDFQPTFAIPLRFCFCKARDSMKMNRNRNMIEERREEMLSTVVKAVVPVGLFQAFSCYWKSKAWEAGSCKEQGHIVRWFQLLGVKLCILGSDTNNFRACRAVFKLFSLPHWQQASCAWWEHLNAVLTQSTPVILHGWTCDKYPCATGSTMQVWCLPLSK